MAREGLDGDGLQTREAMIQSRMSNVVLEMRAASPMGMKQIQGSQGGEVSDVRI